MRRKMRMGSAVVVGGSGLTSARGGYCRMEGLGSAGVGGCGRSSIYQIHNTGQMDAEAGETNQRIPK